MRGYTLLELMTVVALLMILSALSVTGLQPLVTRFRRQEAVEATAQFLVRARQRAMETGRCHLVEVVEAAVPVPLAVPLGDEGNGLRMLSRTDADCVSAPVPAALREVESVTLAERSRVRPVTADPIVFMPNGRIQGGFTVRLMVGLEERDEVRALPHGPVCVMEPGGGCP